MQKLSKRIESIELNRIQPLTLYVAIMYADKKVKVTSNGTKQTFTRDEYYNWKRKSKITINQDFNQDCILLIYKNN